MNSDELPWLVKSGGRVLGPFTQAKLEELLRSREISVLDEVSVPMRRWHTIQIHPDLTELVETLRRTNVSDKTEATWTPTNATGNLTQTVTESLDSELTEELTSDLTDDLSDFATNKEIVIHDVKEQTSSGASATRGRYQMAAAQNTAI